MLLADVIGQQAVKQQLLAAFQRNRLSHALLFTGPTGSGPLPLALAFAQYINCENRTETDACGRCPSCVKAAKLIHPDIHFSYPFIAIKKEKKELATDYVKEWRKAFLANPYLNLNEWVATIADANKQGNINVKECQDIIRKLNLKAFESEYKVLIMWRPETLKGQGNMLLKILEEPPPKTVFILVAEERDQILNTIVSRTQEVKVPLLHHREVQIALTEREGVAENQAFQTAHLADGDYNEALQLLNNTGSDNEYLFRQWMDTCRSGLGASQPNHLEMLKEWIEQFATLGREKQKNFFRYALHVLRELTLMHFNADMPVKLLDSEKEYAQSLLPQLSPQKLAMMTEAINNAHYYIERNAYHKILAFNTSLTIAKIMAREETVEMEHFATATW